MPLKFEMVKSDTTKTGIKTSMTKAYMVSLFGRCIALWGIDLQMDMLQEECGELVAVVNQYKRGRVSVYQLAEEMADVSIMLDQISMSVPGLRDSMEATREAKLDRLAKRVLAAQLDKANKDTESGY